MKPFSLTGLITAPYTPYNADCSLKLETVPLIAEHLARQKLDGAFICGTTGEWPSMTRDERRALAEAWREAIGNSMKLIVHVGHSCLADSQDLARHAESIGADAIAALVPAFFRPATVEDAVDHCRLIARVAPRTPFYYYHMPDMTGADFNMIDFLPLAIRSIPTFKGIKFTHYNLWDFGLTLAAAGNKYDILCGRDEVLLAALALGAKGAVGSTYNYAAALNHRLMRTHAANQLEAATKQMAYLQKTIVPIVKYGGLPAAKAVMAMSGVDCGPVRPPLARPTAQRLKALRRELGALDFFSKIGV